MFDFLRRIPEKLGLKLVGASRSRPAVAEAKSDHAKKVPRGRGTGRGTTPKGGVKPKGNGLRRQNRG